MDISILWFEELISLSEGDWFNLSVLMILITTLIAGNLQTRAAEESEG